MPRTGRQYRSKTARSLRLSTESEAEDGWPEFQWAVGSNSNSGWVEGETKIFIDGEKYPTVNYTGTEDYFGGSYAWGCDNGNFPL